MIQKRSIKYFSSSQNTIQDTDSGYEKGKVRANTLREDTTAQEMVEVKISIKWKLLNQNPLVFEM